MTAETWAGLPESTRWAFKWLAKQYEGGFTGEIRLQSLNGSVEEIRPEPVIKPSREMERAEAVDGG